MNRNSSKPFNNQITATILLLVIIGITFLPTLFSDFIYWDDDRHLFENPLIESIHPSNIIAIFGSTTERTYIPFTTLSFALENHFFGLNPFIFHLNNLLLHLGISYLVFRLCLQLGFTIKASFLSALIFGIHPLHVESVAWITERKDVLYSLFYIFSLTFYCRYLKTNRKIFFIMTVLFGLFSILSKAMALSLPLVMLAIDWYKKRKFSAGLLIEKLWHCLYIVPIAWITFSLNTTVITLHNSALKAILIYCWSLAFYIHKFIFPVTLLPMYELPQPITILNSHYSISLIIIVLSILSIIKFRNNRLYLFSWAYLFASIFFLLRCDEIPGASIVADRFMYLPSLGFCLLMGRGYEVLTEKVIKVRPIQLLILILVLLLGIKTFSQCQIWQTDLNLWNHVIKNNQSFHLAYNSRGVAHFRRENLELALEDFDQAIKLNPKYAKSYYNRAKLYGALNKPQQAINDFNIAIKFNPFYFKAFNDRGVVYSKINRLDKAIEDYNNAIKINPEYISVYNNRGIAYKLKGKYELALKDYNRVIELSPHFFQAYINRGNLYKAMKQYDSALSDYNQAIALNPKVGNSYFLRAAVNFDLGKYRKALDDFKKVLSIEKDNKTALNNISLINNILEGLDDTGIKSEVYMKNLNRIGE